MSLKMKLKINYINNFHDFEKISYIEFNLNNMRVTQYFFGLFICVDFFLGGEAMFI